MSLVFPGQPLSSSVEKNDGVYIDSNGVPRASLVGIFKHNSMHVPKLRANAPTENSIVLGTVLRLNSQQATIAIQVVDNIPLPHGEDYTGVIRSQDVRATEKDKIKIADCFRGGDIVAGQVATLAATTSERDASSFVRNANGRQYNSSNTLYLLPSDQSEFARHDKQHRLLELALGGLYPVPAVVESILSPDPDRPKAILDLGAGSGLWCIQMALKFTHCEVVGVDLVANASRAMPPNCRFEFDDINLGLPHFHNKFDLVHSRAIVNGINDFEKYIEDVVACLKPGGIAILVEGDWRPYREDKITPYPPAGLGVPNGSWWARICFEAFERMKKRGSSIDGGDEIEKGLRHPLIRDSQTDSLF
ncbi:hypothetical protein FRC17_009060, partial [Serendipita sp. 399]